MVLECAVKLDWYFGLAGLMNRSSQFFCKVKMTELFIFLLNLLKRPLFFSCMFLLMRFTIFFFIFSSYWDC